MASDPSRLPKPRAKPSWRLLLHPEADHDYVHFQFADRHPFDAGRSGVTRRTAWWLGDAALLTYWAPDTALARFEATGLHARFLEQGATQCYVAHTRDFAIVAFRGTQPDHWHDVFDDARLHLVPWTSDEVRVHGGWKDALDRIWGDLEAALQELGDVPVWFAGHSLGAALATLAGDRFASTAGVLTIASPRIGNAAFADAYNARLGTLTARYVEHRDFAARLPPELFGYRHVGELRWIGGDGTVRPAAEAAAAIEEPHDARLEALPMMSSLLDHMPRGYTVDMWNDYILHAPDAAPRVEEGV